MKIVLDICDLQGFPKKLHFRSKLKIQCKKRKTRAGHLSLLQDLVQKGAIFPALRETEMGGA